MNYPLTGIISILVSFGTLQTVGAAPFDPQARAAAIAPYLDNDVIAVGRVDLSRFDLAASMKVIADLMKPSDEERAMMAAAQEQMGQMLAAVVNAGGGEIFAVVSLADIPQHGPFLIVTVNDGGDQNQLVRVLSPFFARGDDQTCESLGDVVFCGHRGTLTRLKTLAIKERPELADAFKAAGDTTAQLVVTLSDDQRRVVREMLPQFPKQLGGGDGGAVADGLQWAAIGIESPPKLAVNITIQSKDEQSATALRRVIVGSLTWVRDNTPVRELMPKFDLLVELAQTPNVVGDRLVLTLDDDYVTKLIAAMNPAIVKARRDAQRMHCFNNLKQLALAMHNYHDTHKRFPAAASYDHEGKPLLSWRVHLLPFLEADDLYKQFRLDEPWDSAHNQSLILKMPTVFACPAASLAPGTTAYLAPYGDGMAFDGKEGIRIRDFTDGTSNTIMIVEANTGEAVVWTRPADLNIDPENPLRGLGGTHDKGFNTALTDGSVRFISEAVDKRVLRLLFTRNDGEPIPDF